MTTLDWWITIIIREPALQNLKRDYRQFLKDSDLTDKEYVYVDYSQYEAGILAGITKNDKLIDLYHRGEIYDKLAKVSHVDKDMAKVFFYYFAYGGVIVDGAESFFNEYCSKAKIDEMIEQITEEGKVGTKLGNVRVLNPEGDRKWVVNHLIQSTSSLIFKQALLNVEVINSNNRIQLVMPMHDAALYIVDSHDEDVKDEIKRQFITAFKNYFPNINPIVKFKDYFAGE